MFSTLWNEGVYRPVYNALLFLIEYSPGTSLALGIIMFTILLRTVLLWPTLRATRQQAVMQRIKPEIDALQQRYKDDQTRLAEEMMKLWKRENVSPVAGCLPLLLQMPFLFAIFQVLQHGFNAQTIQHAYASLQSFDLASINTFFFHINLIEKDTTMILPIAVALLQFVQLKSMFIIQKKQGTLGTEQMQQFQKFLLIFLPLLLLISAQTFPAGLALYWGVGTAYMIAQQFAQAFFQKRVK